MTQPGVLGTGGRPPRVLFWTEAFWPFIGGMETRSAQLLPGMRERGFDYMVVTDLKGAELPKRDRYGEIPIRRLPLRESLGSRDPLALLRVRKRVRELTDAYSPDLIHLDFAGPTCFFPLMSDGHDQPPRLLTVQYGPPEEATGTDTISERIVGSADWVAFCSTATRDQWERWLGRPLERRSVVTNAVKVEPDPAPLPDGAPHFVCVGRLTHEKGYDIAIRALPLLRERFPEARLTVAGDGEERTALEALARRLGVDDGVHFPGWVPPGDVPELMKSATLVFVPSRREAFGLVAAEAAAVGRPVVASRVGGLSEVVDDGRSGCLVAPGSASDLGRAAVRLLEDGERLRRMAVDAHSTAERKFSWTTHLDEYERLYRELMEARR